MSDSIIISPTKQTGLGHPYTNRKWEKYRNSISAKRRELVLKAKTSPLPAFDDATYLGGVYNRVASDKMLKQLYEDLSSLVLVECVDNTGEFVETIEAYLNNIVNAKSWTSTAHDKNLDYFYGRAYWVELCSSKIIFQ